MELKIVNGRYQIGPNRGLIEICDAEELIQRINMKLKVRRGTFIPLPDYGSRLYLLQQVKPSERCSAARQYVLEALSEEKEIELSSLELSDDKNGSAKLSLSFVYKGRYTLSAEAGI